MKIHHVGYLTKNIEKAESAFERLGFVVEEPAQKDEIRDIIITFMVNGDYRVELIQPRDKESPMYPLLKNYKNTPYHFCYEVPDIDEAIAELENSGYMVIQAPKEAPCINGQKVSFLLAADMGIIELLEVD